MVLRATRRWIVAAACVAGVLGAGHRHADAQPAESEDVRSRREQAVKLAEQGSELLAQKRYDEAVQKFREADRVIHSPKFVLFQARAEQARGRYVEARALLKQVIDEKLPDYAPETFFEAKKEAKQLLAALDPRMPRWSLKLAGEATDGADVALDGKRVSATNVARPVNPGRHKVLVRAADGRESEKSFSVADGESVELEIDLGAALAAGEAPPPRLTEDEEPSDGQSYLVPGILYGIGGASLLVGAITGGVFAGRASELKDRCPDNHCAPEDEEEGNSVTTLGNVSTATLIIGAVGVVAGTIFLFVPIGGGDEPPATDGSEPSEPSEPSEEEAAWAPRLGIGLGSVVLEGRF